MPTIRNSTAFPNHLLRRMLSWCANELGLPPSEVREAAFTNCARSFRGCAWSSMRILVRIGPPSAFPIVDHSYPRRANAPVYTLADQVEALVHITAHELEHLCQYRERSTTREQATEIAALAVLDTFREHRQRLWDEWSRPPARKPLAPRLSVADKRFASAIAGLERWSARLKLASTKVKKYRRRVRYYERRAAGAGTQRSAVGGQTDA